MTRAYVPLLSCCGSRRRAACFAVLLDGRSQEPFPIDPHQFVALILSKHEDIAFGSDVHVDASSLEGLRLADPEHFDLQTGIEFADVAYGHAHVIDGFKIALPR